MWYKIKRLKEWWSRHIEWPLVGLTLAGALLFIIVMFVPSRPHPPSGPREIDDLVCVINGLVNLVAEARVVHESKPDVVEHDGKKLTAIGYTSFMLYRDENGNLFAHDSLDTSSSSTARENSCNPQESTYNPLGG